MRTSEFVYESSELTVLLLRFYSGSCACPARVGFEPRLAGRATILEPETAKLRPFDMRRSAYRRSPPRAKPITPLTLGHEAWVVDAVWTI